MRQEEKFEDIKDEIEEIENSENQVSIKQMEEMVDRISIQKSVSTKSNDQMSDSIIK